MSAGNGNYYTSYYNGISPEYFYRKESEKKELKKLGLLCGSGFLLYIIVQQVLLLIISYVGLYDTYMNNSLFQSAADIIVTFASVMLPFAVVGRSMKKISGEEEVISFEAKVSPGKNVLAVVAGAGLCMIAGIISSYFVAFASLFGYELSSAEVPMPTGIIGVCVCLVRVVVTAAMAEEIALRGYVLGNLRKYGDHFAICMAAVIFALMHGNLVQSPFALLAGFAIGYLSVKTGSIWTAVLIHGANNLFSVVISYLLDYGNEDFATLVYYIALCALSAAGVICLVIFLGVTRDRKLQKPQTVLTLGEKLKAFFLNPTMIISIAFMLYVTSTYITRV